MRSPRARSFRKHRVIWHPSMYHFHARTTACTLMQTPRAAAHRDRARAQSTGGALLAILLRATGGATAQGPLSLQFGAACVVRVGGRARVCAKLLGMAPASGSAVLSACLLCFVCAKLFGRRPLRGLLSLRGV